MFFPVPTLNLRSALARYVG